MSDEKLSGGGRPESREQKLREIADGMYLVAITGGNAEPTQEAWELATYNTERMRSLAIPWLRNAWQAGERDMAERAARIAEAHGETIGEDCWNHENRRELAKSTCSEIIAKDIRAQLVGGECTCGADRTGPSAEAHSADCPQA